MMQHTRTVKSHRLWFVLAILLFLMLMVLPSIAVAAKPVKSSQVKRLFDDPPTEFSSAPLWVWNDLLTPEQIAGTMQDLASQKVMQVFVHPRPGLMTPYLSEDWFKLWDVALRQAEKLDMNVWIYDENSYPSGFAGGLVPDAMPESRGKGLALKKTQTPPELNDNIVGVFQLADDGFENITAKLRAGETFGKGRYMTASVRLAPQGGWFGGKWYVDLLKPGVTEKFIEITMERYRKHLGDQFGKRVPGWFTDEPHLAPAGGFHWSDGLVGVFEQRWGYDLVDHLPYLSEPTGDWKRVRHNYYNLLLEQFIERWAKPCYEYCEKHDLDFTGHYWEHGWPGAGHGGDNMAMYAWHQRPAIDTLMNQYSESVNAQFGNARAVKELSSVANQLGRERTLCEAYGAGGWDLRFEDMKRIGDWLYVLGVNTMNEHLSYITIRGARKRDHPQSFSYHTPWWEAYHVMAEYFTRLSLVMSRGQQVNQVLVIEPTTTTWMYQGNSTPSGRLGEIGNSFQKLVMDLEGAQAEYDIGCEDIMFRHGSTEGARLRVGQRLYDTVVLTPLTENLNAKTTMLLEAYLEAGGAVLCCGEPPARVDGALSDRGQAMAQRAGWKRIKAKDVPERLLARSGGDFAIERAPGDKGILFHHRRVVADGQFLFLVNTSIDAPSAGTIRSDMKGLKRWNLDTGKVEPYPFAKTEEGIEACFELPPSGSLLLFLSKKGVKPPKSLTLTSTPVAAQSDAVEVRRLAPNVLTLDYVDVTAGGETLKDVYFYRANRFAFQKNGMDRNPWDSAVQFKDELISKTFKPDSGFSASYKFTIEQAMPANLAIVIERSDLYTITCNGHPVQAKKGDWWLDKAFGRIDIAKHARVGQNVVTIKAQPFTIYHELESAYLLGDFSLKPAARGFVVVPETPLEIAVGARPGWRQQGHPFYGAGVMYRQRFDLGKRRGSYKVSLPDWRGSVARVEVNGKQAGYIAAPPWECDVTKRLKRGENTIDVVVIGTLKNTLGPHHNGPGLGSAWPSMFHRGPETGPPPGRDYAGVDYGLFAPFVLRQEQKQ